MDAGIGATLRDARSRRKVDLSEVEASTRIRARYLRAIESEEWDTLPGDVYARGFIRTYASYLGLDGERLADEYRRQAEAGAAEGVPRREPSLVAAGTGERRVSGRTWGVLATLGVVGLLVAVGLSDGGSEPGPAPSAQPEPREERRSVSAPASSPGVILSLEATGEVWVCLLDDEGRPLVDGTILASGAEEGPFRSAGFTLSLGNGEISMTVDGQQAEVPSTSSPVGYAIDGGGALEPLAEGERPTCT